MSQTPLAGAAKDYAAATTDADFDPGLSAGAARMARMRAEEEAKAAALANPESASEHHGRVTLATRKPFGTMDQKLFWPKRSGFHRHWFNDTAGRVEAALEAGYAHVMDSKGKPVRRIVGKLDNGAGLAAFLMEIPQEWFDMDMNRGQESVDETVKDIYRGKAGPLSREKNSYVPSQGISIRDASR